MKKVADPTHFIFAKVNPNANTMRETNYIISCPNCQWEREVSYCQFHNIRNKVSNPECKSCLIELGIHKLNTEGLKLGRKGHQNKKQRTNFDKNRKQMQIVATFGIIFSDEDKLRMRNARLGRFAGENHPNWQGGISSERNKLCASDTYKQLRKEVFKRDGYKCVLCGVNNNTLEMDHIKEWCNYPELRFEPTNCRTLCRECHSKTPNYKSKATKLKKEKKNAIPV